MDPSPDDPTRETPDGLSRRALLASTAAATAVAATGVLGSTAAAAATPARRTGEPATDVVAHVRDRRTVDIYVGEEHRQVRDPELAARLLRAAR